MEGGFSRSGKAWYLETLKLVELKCAFQKWTVIPVSLILLHPPSPAGKVKLALKLVGLVLVFLYSLCIGPDAIVPLIFVTQVVFVFTSVMMAEEIILVPVLFVK